MAVWNTTKTVLLTSAMCWVAASAMAQESPTVPLLTPFMASDALIGVTRGDTLVLTFDQAIARVLQLNPSLREAKSRAGAGRGLVRQAKLYPNPEIGLDVEDWGRQSTGGPSQTTVGISQTIPLSGRRGAARQQAEQELSAAQADVSTVMLALYREAAGAFAALQGAQRNVGVATDRVRLAREIESIVKLKQKEGAVSAFEVLRAEASTSLAYVDSLNAESEARRAQAILAGFWSDSLRQPLVATNELRAPGTLPPEDTLQSWLAGHPELESLRASARAREAELRLARALARPEPTFGIGYRRLHDNGDNAAIASVALPLPLFDRNQGNTQASTARVEEATAALRSAELRLATELRDLWAQLAAQTNEIAELQTRVLPTAQEAMEQIDEAYRLGRQPYINVLDAQRTLAEIQLRLVETEVERAQTTARLESLTGHPLTSSGR